VAASILCAAELPYLVKFSLADYEKQIVALVDHSYHLKNIKELLANKRMSCPLFDSERYTRDFEALLIRMYERNTPEHLPA